jgi:hypothetical protein
VLLQCIHRLLAIGDTIGMASEMVRTIGAAFCSYVPLTILVALASNGIIPPDTRITLCAVACGFYSLFNITVLSRHSWGKQRTRTGLNSSTVAVMSRAGSDIFEGNVSMRCVTDTPGTLDPTKLTKALLLLQSAPLKAAYAQYVEKALCFESYKFLVDGVVYADTVFETPSKQVNNCDKFIFYIGNALVGMQLDRALAHAAAVVALAAVVHIKSY